MKENPECQQQDNGTFKKFFSLYDLLQQVKTQIPLYFWGSFSHHSAEPQGLKTSTSTKTAASPIAPEPARSSNTSKTSTGFNHRGTWREQIWAKPGKTPLGSYTGRTPRLSTSKQQHDGRVLWPWSPLPSVRPGQGLALGLAPCHGDTMPRTCGRPRQGCQNTGSCYCDPRCTDVLLLWSLFLETTALWTQQVNLTRWKK